MRSGSWETLFVVRLTCGECATIDVYHNVGNIPRRRAFVRGRTRSRGCQQGEEFIGCQDVCRGRKQPRC